jgi:protein O-GlcNAcase/histone acetyltransferase
LLFCPTDYCAAMARPTVAASPYLRELGERLEPGIQIFWTGPDVVSASIDVDGVREAARVLGRRPLLWDNLHANDYDVGRVHLGPYHGRPAALRGEVAGILLNPNNELPADTVPLATLAAYLHDDAYEPRAAFLEAIRAWAGAFEPVGREPPSADDLAFLADFLYLPFEHGPAARTFLDDVRALLTTPPAVWGETFTAVTHTVTRFADLAERLARLRDRELVVSLYPYVQDVLIEAERTARRLAGRRAGRAPEAPRDGIANAYGRGFAEALRRLLPEEASRASGRADGR